MYIFVHVVPNLLQITTLKKLITNFLIANYKYFMYIFTFNTIKTLIEIWTCIYTFFVQYYTSIVHSIAECLSLERSCEKWYKIHDWHASRGTPPPLSRYYKYRETCKRCFFKVKKIVNFTKSSYTNNVCTSSVLKKVVILRFIAWLVHVCGPSFMKLS